MQGESFFKVLIDVDDAERSANELWHKFENDAANSGRKVSDIVDEVFDKIKEQASDATGALEETRRVTSSILDQLNGKLKVLREQRNAAFSGGDMSLGNSINAEIDSINADIEAYNELLKAIDAQSKALEEEILKVDDAKEAFDKLVESQEDAEEGMQSMAGVIGGALSNALSLFLGKTGSLQKQISNVGSIYDSFKKMADMAKKWLGDQAVSTDSITNAFSKLLFSSNLVGKALLKLGVSAKTAQAAMTAFSGSIPLVAVTAFIALLSKLIRKHQEAKAAAEALQEEQREYYRSVAGDAAPAIEAFEELRLKWVALGNDMDAKKKFIKDNESALSKLSVAVNDVKSAEQLFIENTENYVRAQAVRAAADNERSRLVEKMAEKMAIEQEMATLPETIQTPITMGTSSSGAVMSQWATIENPERKKLQEQLDSLNKDIEEGFSSVTRLDGEYSNLLGTITDGMKDTRNMQDAIAQASIELEEATRNLEASKSGTVAEYQAALKDYEAKKRALESLTGRESSGGGKTGGSASDDAEKYLRSAQQKIDALYAQLTQREVALEKQRSQAVVDAMEEGFDKEKAQLEFEHNTRVDTIEDEYEKTVEAITRVQQELYKSKNKGSLDGFKLDENDPLIARARTIRDEALKQENERNERVTADAEAEQMRRREENRLAYLKTYGDFKEKELAITEEYDAKIATASDEWQKKILGEEKKSALYELQKQYSAVFSLIFADAESLTNAQLAKAIEYTQEEIKKATESGDIEKLAELYGILNDKMEEKSSRGTGFSKIAQGIKDLLKSNRFQKIADDKTKSDEDRRNAIVNAINSRKSGEVSITSGLKQVSSVLGVTGNALESFDGKLGEIGKTLSDISSEADNLVTIFTSRDKGSIISAGVQGALDFIQMVGSQIAKNKQAQEEWNSTIDESAQKLRMLQLDALGYSQSNIFGVEDPFAKAKASADQYLKSMEEVSKMTSSLGGGQVQTGTKKVASGSNALKGAGAGAAMGAAVGTAVGGWAFGLGTIIGTAIGAVAGAIGGALTKETVPVFETLAEHYGELYDKDFNLNPKIIADYEKLDDSTKQIVDNWDEIKDKAASAMKDLEENLSEFTGDIGTKLRDTLVEAWKNKDLYGAVDDFNDYVNDIISNILSQKAFAVAFEDLFNDLEANMKASYGEGGDNDITDDLAKFNEAYKDRLELFNEMMSQAQSQMEEMGYGGFTNNASTTTQQNATAGGFQTMSQDTASELNGRFTALQIAGENILLETRGIHADTESMRNATDELRSLSLISMGYLEDIERNTRVIPGMSETLEEIKKYSKQMVS